MDRLKPVDFPKLTQARLVPIQIQGQCELDWVGLKPRVIKVTILCVVRAGRWWWWCVGWSVGVLTWLMRFVWRSLGVGRGELVWVGEWVLDKWWSLYANTHYKYEYSVLNSIWPKSHYWKNTSQFYYEISFIMIG